MTSLGDAEFVARFVFHRSHVRADHTVKPDAFMPPPSLELSVTKHYTEGDGALWQRGTAVAVIRGRPLTGRADVAGSAVRAVEPLDVVAAPIPDDPNHAHVIGWPPRENKPAQKMLAVRLAAASLYRPSPTG